MKEDTVVTAAAAEPDTITEQRPTADWARGVEGQNRHLTPSLSIPVHEPSDEAALAHTGASGDADDSGTAALREQPRRCLTGVGGSIADLAQQAATTRRCPLSMSAM